MRQNTTQKAKIKKTQVKFNKNLILFRMRCISCGRNVTKYVEFKCPTCEGEEKYIIVRCDACRILGRKYVCPKCGFTGP